MTHKGRYVFYIEEKIKIAINEALSIREKKIIIYMYYKGYYGKKIAKMYKITPSRIYQIKNNALYKIKKYIMEMNN